MARLPLLYGNSGGRGLGASDSLLEAIERGEKPRLFVDEWRTPLEVSNAAEALVELLEFDHGGVLHLAGPDRVTRHEFGLAVLRLPWASSPGPPAARSRRRARPIWTPERRGPGTSASTPASPRGTWRRASTVSRRGDRRWRAPWPELDGAVTG